MQQSGGEVSSASEATSGTTSSVESSLTPDSLEMSSPEFEPIEPAHPTEIGKYLHNNMLAHGTVTNDDDDVGLHEYSC